MIFDASCQEMEVTICERAIKNHDLSYCKVLYEAFEEDSLHLLRSACENLQKANQLLKQEIVPILCAHAIHNADAVELYKILRDARVDTHATLKEALIWIPTSEESSKFAFCG